MKLYIKLGKCIGLTIRHLGYPTKNALKTWYREYDQNHELRAVYTRSAKFSQAQKEWALLVGPYAGFLGESLRRAAGLMAIAQRHRHCSNTASLLRERFGNV